MYYLSALPKLKLRYTLSLNKNEPSGTFSSELDVVVHVSQLCVLERLTEAEPTGIAKPACAFILNQFSLKL